MNRVNAMTHAQLMERIWIDPARRGGKPRVRGHRRWVSLILELLASGGTHQEILDNYPGLAEEDTLACIACGSEMARERYAAVPLEPVGA